MLVNKSYKFVDEIWKVFVQTNCQDIRYQLIVHSYNCLLFQFFLRPINEDVVEDESEEMEDNILEDGLELMTTVKMIVKYK